MKDTFLRIIVGYLQFLLLFSCCYFFTFILFVVSYYISTLHFYVFFNSFNFNWLYLWYEKQGMEVGQLKSSIFYLFFFVFLFFAIFIILRFAKRIEFKRRVIKFGWVLIYFFCPTFIALGYKADIIDFGYLDTDRYSAIKPFGISIFYFLTKGDPFNSDGFWHILNKPAQLIGFEILTCPDSLPIWLELISVISAPLLMFHLKKNFISKFLIS